MSQGLLTLSFLIDEHPRLQEFLDRFYPDWVELDDDIMTQYGDWYRSEEEKE